MTEPHVDAIGFSMPPSMATILMTYYEGSQEESTDAHAAAVYCTAADELDSVIPFAARTMPQHSHNTNPLLQHTTEKVSCSFRLHACIANGMTCGFGNASNP